MKAVFYLLLLPFLSISQTNVIITFAGTGANGYSGDGGQCIRATFSRPQNIISDSTGNLYFADADNNVIRRIDGSGIVSTIAGNGTDGYSGDNGPATLAMLSTPTGLAVDAIGSIYIADNGNNRIRKVDASGIITTIAGTGVNGFGGDNGPATLAELDNPYGVGVDHSGNVYFSAHARVRKVATTGIITTVAGTGMPGFSGDNGPATSAQLREPSDIAISNLDELYIPDWNNYRVRRVNSSGIITTIAGNGLMGNSGDGAAATSAKLTAPGVVNFDDSGNVFISDVLASCVRRVTTTGIITTVAGNGTAGFSGDGGPATAAQLNGPSGVAFNRAGNMYISDAYDKRIVSPAGLRHGTRRQWS
jgi:trimeric autotransporter adhesin